MRTSAQATALAPSEIAVLARAMSRAPSVHNTQPWRMRVRHSDVDLIERASVALPSHDPEGRDRMVSCGAALAHLQTAARVLCRATTTTYPAGGAVVATVHAEPGFSPDHAELARFHAIGRRRSHRRWFSAEPVSEVDQKAVSAAGGETCVCAVVPRHLGELGAMLGFATRAFRADPAYQRELRAWTASTFGSHASGAEDGVPEAALGSESLPAAGLVRRETPVPDDARLTARLEAEHLLVFCTEGDSRREHLAAGAGCARTWLEATARGLAGSVLTQPLHLCGFREVLAERLALPGLPQVIFRYGHPLAPAPPSPRRPLADLLPD
ncbi:Acg family FMN-binding oxidoreductase [Amycolatopsis sp. NPDC001319]|uniref:Acg family FMN-binding oxidoreductase n=1 Tax=unclassified Amycolatopsis TaxID=2618356 RepID=UPI0036A349CF